MFLCFLCSIKYYVDVFDIYIKKKNITFNNIIQKKYFLISFLLLKYLTKCA